MSERELRIDDNRTLAPETGIFVRAINSDGKWSALDIAWLDAPSLLQWLRSRGDRSPWAEATVFQLLRHEPGARDQADLILDQEEGVKTEEKNED